MSDMKKPDGMITFTPESFLNLLTTLVNRFGSAGESMIFQMGWEKGREFCRGTHEAILDSDESFENKLSIVIGNPGEVEWIEMALEEINMDTGSVKVILHNNVFKEHCVKLNLPQCYFLRGYLSGILKELSNRDYSFDRSECYSKGDKHCSIRMTPDSP